MQNTINNTNVFGITFALTYFSLAFMVYFFSYKFQWLEGFSKKFVKDKQGNSAFIFIVRSIGFILLGFIPALIFPIIYKIPLKEMGVQIPQGEKIWLWFFIPTIIFLIASIFRSKKKINFAFYPQVREQNWRLSSFILNSLFWTLYLIGYEFAFRGYLFFPFTNLVGIWPAIALNCALYSISHIPKGAGEAFGAFFLGILFCFITYYTNSILIPIILHMILAICNDYKAIQANPEMNFRKK